MGGIFKSMKRTSAKLGRAMGLDTVVPGLRKKTAVPPVHPLPDEEEIQRAQRRALAARAGRSGRTSTILSGADEPLG